MAKLAGLRACDYCEFELQGRAFGIPVQCVRELHAPTSVTPIPGAPSAVRGYANLRGHLHLVVDPHEVLIGSPGDQASCSTWIVLRTDDGDALAFEVERVTGIEMFPEDSIDRPMACHVTNRDTSELGEGVAVGYAKLDGRLVTLVDLKALMTVCLNNHQRI